MTTKQTLKALKSAGKPVCLSHLYRLFTILNIAPLGRSRPQQYPADTAARILAHLGFSSLVTITSPGRGRAEVENEATLPAKKLISVRALRAAKNKHTNKNKGTK